MTTRPSPDVMRRIYAETEVIAVVGASSDAAKKANSIPSYLQEMGYRIVPVNPRYESVFGEQCYATLADVPGAVDIVDVFRPQDEAPGIARQAAAIGAKVLWLQEGIVSEEANRLALDAGMMFVSDLCLGAMHAALDIGPRRKTPD
jgi:hypothetical protein